MHANLWSIFTIFAVLIQVIPFSIVMFLAMEHEK